MTPVDMMINILHKLLSTGTVAAKAGTVEVLLGEPEASRACMVNHIKRMGHPHRRATISIRHPQPTQVLLLNSTPHPVGTALLPEEASAIMAVLGQHKRPRIPSSIPALAPATTTAYLMSLGAPSRTSRGKTRGLVLTWVNRMGTRTKSAISAIRPKYPVVQALPWANPEDDLDPRRMRQARQHCHSRKDKVKVKANKVTVDTWAIRCTVNRVPISVEAQEVWAADTTNREDRTIKRVATELTVPGMVPDSMGTTTGVDGGPTMGIRSRRSGCISRLLLFHEISFQFDVHASLAKMV